MSDLISGLASIIPSKRSIKAGIVFRVYFYIYVSLLSSVIFCYAVECSAENIPREGTTWFYFAIGIGAIYVFIAFYYFYENYLQPYITDLEKLEEEEELKQMNEDQKKEDLQEEQKNNDDEDNESAEEDENTEFEKLVLSPRSIYSWAIEWIAPAVTVQFLVIVFFWMTASITPYKESLYTHPFMYGQVYEQINNYMEPRITAAGFSKKLDEVDNNKEKELTMNSALFLESQFAGHLKPAERDIPQIEGQEYNKNYINAVTGVVSKIYNIPFTIALTFAFLGTLMYTLNDIICRFFISDLYPKTFISYIVRFLFTPALCMVIAYFFMNDWITNGAPMIFFLVGFFPQIALQFIEEKTKEHLKIRSQKKEEIPLGLVQGMTDYNMYRLKEMGIGDAQNLAYSDINYLRKNWYNDRQLGDFIAQAMLLIHLREDFSKLQNNGIRNIIAFKELVKDKECTPTECEKFAKTLGVASEKLQNLHNLIKASPMKDRIGALQMIMTKFDEKERRKLTSGH